MQRNKHLRIASRREHTSSTHSSANPAAQTSRCAKLQTNLHVASQPKSLLFGLELRSLPAAARRWTDLQLSCDFVPSMANCSRRLRSLALEVQALLRPWSRSSRLNRPWFALLEQAFSRQSTFFNQISWASAGMLVSTIHGRTEQTSGDFRKRRCHHQAKQLSFF